MDHFAALAGKRICWDDARMSPLHYHPVIPNTGPSPARCAQGGHLPSELRAPKAKCSASFATGMQEAESHCTVMLSRKQECHTEPSGKCKNPQSPKMCTYLWLMNPGPITFLIKDGEIAQIPHNHLIFLNGPDIHATQELRRQRS